MPILRSSFWTQGRLRDGFSALNEAGASETVTDGHIRGSDADDEIIGFSGENFVELGAGDDIFAALSNQGETGDNRWDFYDQVRYDHASKTIPLARLT